MKRIIFTSAALLIGAVVGCGNNTSTPDMGATCPAVACSNGQTCDTADGMCKNPAFPTLSTSVIDRMGRPAVNTALTNPFDVVTMFNGQAETGDATKARYNADGDPNTWLATWAPTIKPHLGVFDAIDDVCKNQFAYGALTQLNYTTLSDVLAGDALQVDTSKTTCTQYLGAENVALGGAGDCGGRTLSMDVVDVTYGALATGNITTGFSDGITASSGTPTATFPFMASPL